MARPNITREWSRTRVQLRGTKAPSRWLFWVGGFAIITAFFLGRGCSSRQENVPVVPLAESTGGPLDADNSVLADVLRGGVLSVPIEDTSPKSAAAQQGVQKQSTTEVKITDGAKRAVLRPLEGRQGSGAATSAFASGQFQHVLVASLPLPPEGFFYTVWLIRPSPFDFFEAGRLIQRADDLRWYALFTAADDRRDYHKVVVTLESGDGNAAPGDAVLEGVLELAP